MLTTFLFLGLFVGILNAQDAAPSKTLWRSSVTALTVANVLDIHSSWGKYELNHALAGQDHRFGAQGALIKLGIQGGLIGTEYLIMRGHPSKKLYRAISYINFGAAAGFTGVAMHNYTIPQPQVMGPPSLAPGR